MEPRPSSPLGSSVQGWPLLLFFLGPMGGLWPKNAKNLPMPKLSLVQKNSFGAGGLEPVLQIQHLFQNAVGHLAAEHAQPLGGTWIVGKLEYHAMSIVFRPFAYDVWQF